MTNNLVGAWLIADERQRQISIEGWTPAHDREHIDNSLLTAARCYLENYTANSLRERQGELPDISKPANWPWVDGWKPTPDDPIRQLVKAGALIAAEIDRLMNK